MDNKFDKIICNAKMYEESSYLLNNNKTLLASYVNAALSLELYLKAIYYKENSDDFKVNNRHSHNISKIFEALNGNTKEKIKKNYDVSKEDKARLEKLSSHLKIKIESSLEEQFSYWSIIFVNTRYYYDNEEHLKMELFPNIVKAIKSAL